MCMFIFFKGFLVRLSVKLYRKFSWPFWPYKWYIFDTTPPHVPRPCQLIVMIVDFLFPLIPERVHKTCSANDQRIGCIRRMSKSNMTDYISPRMASDHFGSDPVKLNFVSLWQRKVQSCSLWSKGTIASSCLLDCLHRSPAPLPHTPLLFCLILLLL